MGTKTIRRAHAVTPLSAIQNEMSLWTRLSEPYVLNVCEKVQASGKEEIVQEETTMNENDKKVLRDWISAFNKAMCEKDVKTLDILMEDDLVGTLQS